MFQTELKSLLPKSKSNRPKMTNYFHGAGPCCPGRGPVRPELCGPGTGSPGSLAHSRVFPVRRDQDPERPGPCCRWSLSPRGRTRSGAGDQPGFCLRHPSSSLGGSPHPSPEGELAPAVSLPCGCPVAAALAGTRRRQWEGLAAAAHMLRRP